MRAALASKPISRQLVRVKDQTHATLLLFISSSVSFTGQLSGTMRTYIVHYIDKNEKRNSQV